MGGTWSWEVVVDGAVVIVVETVVTGVEVAKKRVNFERTFYVWVSAQCTRFFQNLPRFKVNGGISSMHPCMVPFELALYLEVFGQVLVAPFEF